MTAGEALVLRDDWGVPHVRAETEEDAFFAVGYAQAEDHAELMMRHYAMLRGELAAFTGDPADVAKDVQSRRWRHLEECRATFAALSEPVRALATAFISGVQAFLDAHPERSAQLRPQLEPVLAVGVHRLAMFPYYVLEGLSACLGSGVDVPDDVCDVVALLKARRQSVGASNEWVLMPSRTAEGTMMVLSDPHGSLDGLPMSEVEVEAGDLKYMGFHLIGAALPMLGHTRNIAWGCTTGSPVVSDCYQVEVDADDPGSYRYDGELRLVRTERVAVEVRGQDEPVVAEVEFTDHNGVLSAVVAREGSTAYVVSSPYMHVPHLLEEQAYAHLRAGSVHDVYQALRPMGWFPQNLMYGDSSGNALYVRNGRTPIRPSGVDVSKPLDGNTASTSWLGIHRVEDLVQILNPECGYLQNNNVAPDRMLADTRNTSLDAARYPAYLYGDRPGRTNTRGTRAVELLSRSIAATVEDAIAIAVDDLMPGIGRWQDALATALDEDPSRRAALSPASRAFAHRLLTHDGRARADSAAALGYWYWRTEMLRLDGATDDVFDRIDAGQPLEAAEQSLLLDAVEAAVAVMLERHGSVNTPMGEAFRIGRGGRSFPGRCATIPARRQPDPDYPFDSLVMPLNLMIYSEPDAQGLRWAMQGSHTQRLTVFGSPVRSYALLNYGQCGVPASPHFVDQARLFSQGRLRPTYFTSEDLAAHVVTTQLLARRVVRDGSS